MIKKLLIPVLILILLQVSVISRAEDRFYINDMVFEEGATECEVAIHLDNETAFGGFESDIYLSAGLTASNFRLAETRKTSSHFFDSNYMDGGYYKILCFSFPTTDLLGNSGPIVYFTLTAGNDFSGSGTIEIKNNVFSTCDLVEHNPVGTVAVVMDYTTGVEETLPDAVSGVEYYTLQGIKVEKERLTPGIYIKRQGGKTTKVVM